MHVHCSTPHGITLRLFEPVKGGFGESRVVEKARLTLQAGVNRDVDAAFIKEWLAEPGNHQLIARGVIGVDEDAEPAAKQGE